ncbi:MAG: IS21-like element helper ATPase IstB [Sulfuricella sp.]|nr:IS21-like element helper ATPase IstB [Sulfuricella sp.]
MTNNVFANIRKHLQTLKLHQMEKALDTELSNGEKEKRPTAEIFERLLSIETGALTEKRIERRIRESKLAERKLLSDFDFKFQPSIDQRQIMELSTLGFIERKQWLILGGSSGTGKSHIAKALLLQGCQQLYRCRYVTATHMLRDLLSGLADNSLDQKLKAYLRPEVLLIDEIGFDRLEQELSRNASLFFKVIEGRYCKQSTILTTNIDFRMLGEYLGDPVVTAAIVDRMVHHAVIITIEGPSYRMHESKQLNRTSKKRPPSEEA